MKINAPRGFEDILPVASPKWRAIETIAHQVAALYNFQEIRTPSVEYSELFHRGVGETSDIVSKETFTFNDRGGESLTLRPEGTAGVVRAAIENNLIAQEGVRAKLYYIAPNFRYERPQKGRLRQHHQFGAEAFGVAEPEQDAECIALQMDFYARCGLRELQLKLNSLGDGESKQRYRDALVAFLSPRRESLSEDSQKRLDANPLRILDSKDPRDRAAIEGAPPAAEYLSPKSADHFARVQELLVNSTVSFTLDPSLVRGFDYYTETLWEVTAGGLGSQNAIGGGGRYDNLVQNLGGRPTPGVGFGSGLERLLLALEAQAVSLPIKRQPLIYLISQSPAARAGNLELIRKLRAANFACEMDLANRSVKAQFKLADRENAAIVLITGDSELAADQITIKTLADGQQRSIARSELLSELAKMPSMQE